MGRKALIGLCLLLLLLAAGCKQRVSDDLAISQSCNCDVAETWWYNDGNGRTAQDLVNYCHEQCGFAVGGNVVLRLKK